MEKHQVPLRAVLKVCNGLQTSPLIFPNLYRSTGQTRNKNIYFRKQCLELFVHLHHEGILPFLALAQQPFPTPHCHCPVLIPQSAAP